MSTIVEDGFTEVTPIPNEAQPTPPAWRLSPPDIQFAGRVLQHQCFGAAYTAGWHTDLNTGEPKQHNIGERLMLVVSELSEGMEGARKGLMDDKLPQHPMLHVELADAVIRIFDTAGYLGADLGTIIAEKMVFNATREDHTIAARLGKGGKQF